MILKKSRVNEICRRLLVLGADPNYADPEHLNTPLHVAAKEGQTLQVLPLIFTEN